MFQQFQVLLDSLKSSIFGLKARPKHVKFGLTPVFAKCFATIFLILSITHFAL